ncbi:MAG: PLP-dependent aminotransferase family protein [Patulibacter sp.]
MADSISFSRGAPSADIVDIEGLKQATIRAFDQDPAGVAGYGTAVGYVPLRKYIAEKHGVPVDHVFVTNGSMQADAFLFDELVTPRDSVVVERPTYDRTLLGLTERGANVRLIGLQEDGIDVDELRAELEGGLRPSFAHVIPNFQNPGGSTLSLAKRHALLALAAEYDFLIFEDDPYVDVRFTGEPLPRMLDLDDSDQRVIYASSFSKTVCPGMRVGYLVGPPELIAKIVRRATNTYISPSQIAQAIVHQFLTGDRYEAALENVKSALSDRSSTLADALRKHLPSATFVQPEGGYFLWVSLPEGEGHNCAKIAKEAADRGVQIVKGTDFLLEGGENAFRLAYSAVKSDVIDEGVRRLAEAVEAARS